MHLGALTYYYLPVVNGVTLTIADWKREAEKHGVGYTVFTSQIDQPLSRDPSVVEFPAVPLHRKMGITVPFFPLNFLEQEMRRKKIDLIHVHHPFVIGDYALTLGQKLKIPVIFTYHTRYEQYPHLYLPFLPKRFVNYLVFRSLVRFMNRCQAVTVALPSLKQELIRRGVKAPIYPVPIGIDTRRFSLGKRAQTRRQLGLSESEIVLLGTGRLMREKNWEFLLRAFKLLAPKNKQVRLVIVGSGPYFAKLLELVDKWHLQKKVQFVTGIQALKMPDYYAAGDIYVNASLTETFGRVFVEAMAAGLPVVAFATPPSQDLLEHGVSGILIKQRRVKEFVGKLEELIKDPSQRKLIGLAAQGRAQELFDLEKSWQSLEKVYRTMV